MKNEAWRHIARRFGQQYGVEVHVGGSEASATDSSIILPGDVPDNMQDAIHGLFLHNKEHILQKDSALVNSQQPILSGALHIVQDLHNNNLALEQDDGFAHLYRTILEYQESKVPVVVLREKLPWQQRAAQELILRFLPHEISADPKETNPALPPAWNQHYSDARVKNFFKKNRLAFKKMRRQLLDLRTNKAAQVHWAQWLLEALFHNFKQEEQPPNQDPNTQQVSVPLYNLSKGEIGGGGLSQGAQNNMQKFMDKFKSLVPKQRSTNDFECISPGDLKQKVPEAETIKTLKQFLTDAIEDVRRSDSGTIDPAKLPAAVMGDDDIYQDSIEVANKKVLVTLMCDASGSMRNSMPDGNQRKDALMRAIGLICQAAEKVKRDDGYDIEIEAWAFGTSDRIIKNTYDRWDPYDFKSKYWRGSGDGGTQVCALVKKVAAMPDEDGTKHICVLVTDGAFETDGEKMLKKATLGGKKWVIIGVGNNVETPAKDSPFRFIANSLDEIEYILTQCIKEAMV